MDLLTNGNYITRQKADELAKYCLNAVQISIYGTTAPVHEAVTMKTGTFDKSMAAARFLIERGVPVRLAYFIQHDNIEDAFRFPEFAESIGANYAFDTKLVPNRNGSKELLRFGVTMDQMARLYRTGLLKRETSFVCTAAVAKSRITARGEVYPCELINTASMGNLKQQSLADIWSSQRRQKLREAIIGYKPHRCGGCHHTSDCEPCAAMRGFNQENHMEQPVSEACFMTTASLIAHGKTPDKSSFFQNDEDCVSSILAQNTMASSPLVQIMRTRAAGTVM
jgi:radical SAM protein with 4Fe4S-binding SPASM domain